MALTLTESLIALPFDRTRFAVSDTSYLVRAAVAPRVQVKFIVLQTLNRNSRCTESRRETKILLAMS